MESRQILRPGHGQSKCSKTKREKKTISLKVKQSCSKNKNKNRLKIIIKIIRFCHRLWFPNPDDWRSLLNKNQHLTWRQTDVSSRLLMNIRILPKTRLRTFQPSFIIMYNICINPSYNKQEAEVWVNAIKKKRKVWACVMDLQFMSCVPPGANISSSLSALLRFT